MRNTRKMLVKPTHNNKALYESIMNKVSKIVKNSLNEVAGWDDVVDDSTLLRYGKEYIAEILDGVGEPYPMNELKYVERDSSLSIIEIIRNAILGCKYGEEQGTFDVDDEYFAVDEYDNTFISIPKDDIAVYLSDTIFKDDDSVQDFLNFVKERA